MDTNNLRIGDLIEAQYKYGCVAGIVTKIGSAKVEITVCDQAYDIYTRSTRQLNITKKRISAVNPENFIVK